MRSLTINFNESDYIAFYNDQTGYYEVELTAPEIGGIYETEITYIDTAGTATEDSLSVQVFVKEPIILDINKTFMWIFDYNNFEVKDVLEMSDYEINIDEETNAKSIINVIKKTSAKAKDIIAVKRNNEIIYWGIIDEIQNEDGKQLYKYTTKYITNLFDRKIKLTNEELIKTTGVEDFISQVITSQYISNTDTFINLSWLELNVLTHTPKQTSVTNVENGIYNLHTWLTNCTQNYDIVYSFSIVNQKLRMTIENKTFNKELIDTKAQAIANYTEVFETDIVSKVIVLYDKVNGNANSGTYTLYLLNDRTTTTNMTDSNRAEGKIETIYTENYEDANQEALNLMKANSYNHNITFDLYDKYIKVGTPIAIKTRESIIYESFISSVKITPHKFYKYICGNIRIKFIDKLLKERNK